MDQDNPVGCQMEKAASGAARAARWAIAGLLFFLGAFIAPEGADADLRAHAHFSDLKAAEERWQALGEGGRKQWGGMQQLAEQRWRIVLDPDPKHWVEDNPAAGTRSRVDFENGAIEIETIVLEDFPNSKGIAQANILTQLKGILDRRDAGGDSVLKNQLLGKSGSKNSASGIDAGLRDKILSSITAEPLAASDGRRQVRYSTRIELAPEHLKVRANRYMPYVMENARRFNLDPRLIMAVIHTESYFNPLAVSEVGAIGLMQIMPQHAGREVFAYLYEQPGKFSVDALYSPRLNIQTGTAYLHLLKRTHFADIRDYRKNTYLAICAYNWGPNAVRRNILDRYDIQRMSADELYALLMQKTPAETRSYLEKVVARVDAYGDLKGS